MELFPFTDAQKNLIGEVERIAAGFAARAGEYDRLACMPSEDILDLHRAGLLTCTVDKKYGGMGFGVHQDDPLSFFLAIEHIARISPATAHCFQVHGNCMQMISKFCSPEQVERFTEPARERGNLMPGAGSEPASHIVTGGIGTLAVPTEGGYIVNGTKHYATNAPGAELLWVCVKDERSGLDQMMVIPSRSPGVKVDESFWDPIGMRACVSPVVEFKDVFVPEENLIGKPGDFFGNDWLGKINLGFTATYVGGMRGMYDFVVQYLLDRGRGGDVQRQQYVGEMRARINAIRLMLYTAICNFKTDEKGAMLMVEEAKWLAVDSGNRFNYLVGQACGSSIMMRKYPVERLTRDLHVHLLHGRHYLTVGVVGKSEMGEPYKVGLSV